MTTTDAWTHRVHADALRRILHAELPSEREHAALSRGVAWDARLRLAPLHGGDVDDDAFPPREHDCMAREHDSMAREHDSMALEHDSMAREHDSMGREYDSVARDHDSIAREHRFFSAVILSAGHVVLSAVTWSFSHHKLSTTVGANLPRKRARL